MKRRLTALIATIALTATVSACSGSAATEGSANETADPANPVTVTIGVTDESKDYWDTFTDLAKDEGIEVELVNFTDYQQPNPIVSQGELDLNQFQHLLFLANYNVSAGEDLVAIGATMIYQLGLYTDKGYTEPADIPDGAEIAIPNDPTNQARALLVLQSADLISLKDGGNALSTPADIDEAASRVTVVPVDANQTTVQLKTLDGAIINNNFAADAGIDPTTAIYSDLEDTSAAEPYINVFATRAKDAENPVYAKLVEIYHEATVTDAVLAESKGTAVVQNQTPAELEAILTGLQDDVTAAKG
ncbi:MetQ/NlpA family ABC transporter substrate-binding protein [Pengzhenrongella frigida]|uniref:Methionine ABC transporter substrate-binding protein n=1 Tax=Pengzhenrongella frigida TaxID=1259133 RepID=A0A4Q5N3M2_9MICO|nr:MetQ/NlpA family ABC transporter substrate-binding protein [Cellulomonas sp. HLT2-17]RYV50611.1 methionine ABC transporter substrate-binding protein [Cellulomonas sp. HLT2-17]